MLQRTILLGRSVAEHADGFGGEALQRGDTISGLSHVWTSGSIFSWISLGLFILAAAGIIIFGIIRLSRLKESAVLEPLKKKFINDEISEGEYITKKAILLKK